MDFIHMALTLSRERQPKPAAAPPAKNSAKFKMNRTSSKSPLMNKHMIAMIQSFLSCRKAENQNFHNRLNPYGLHTFKAVVSISEVDNFRTPSKLANRQQLDIIFKRMNPSENVYMYCV